jgi:hypothetical protein
MKKLYFLIAVLTLSSIGYAQTSKVLVFQPGRGLNNGTDSGSLNGGKDVWTNENEPGTVNDTSNIILAAPTSNCNNTKSNNFIRFDLTTLPEAVDSVFVGFTHLPHTTYCYSNCDANYYFSVVTSSWNENSVSYSNSPSIGADFYGPINITFPNDFGNREYKITDMYRKWKTGEVANHGFAIHSPSVGCNNAAVMFYAYSSDDTAAAKRPYLKIYYKESTNTVKNVSLKASLFPNPAEDYARLSLYSANSTMAKITVNDIYGRELQAVNNMLRAGENNLKLDLAGLADGNYTVAVYSSFGAVTQKLMIKR